jgi:hypothetical protein
MNVSIMLYFTKFFFITCSFVVICTSFRTTSSGKYWSKSSTKQRQQMMPNEAPGLPFFFLGAVAIGAGAGYLQYSLFSGSRGLGAYLSDGKGFKKSGFKPLTKAEMEASSEKKRGKSWFKLPKLDFVEVFDEDDIKITPILDGEGIALSPPIEPSVTDESPEDVIQ